MKRVRYYPSQTLGCIGCGKCCGGWPVPVSEEEVRSISALPLTGLPVPPAQCFQQEKRGWYLKKRDGHCIFLDDEKKCRIHSQFGFDAKPLTRLPALSAGCADLERRFRFRGSPV